MKYIRLLFFFISISIIIFWSVIGSLVFACEIDKEKIFQESIDKECEYMVKRGIWKECTPKEEIKKAEQGK